MNRLEIRRQAERDVDEQLKRVKSVRQTIGLLMQLAMLSFLPALILFQLEYGIPLIVMPACLLVAYIVFRIGTKLREMP